MGAAVSSIITHVRALIPVESLITPAAIAPKIPPTSKTVDMSALLVALIFARIKETKFKHDLRHEK